MKSSETETGNGGVACTKTGTRGNHAGQFIAARDSRNRRVSGLYIRNGRFYGLLWADRGDGRKAARRFPLLDEAGEPIRSLAAAKEAFDVLRSHRRENALPAAGRKPLFADFAAQYLALASTLLKRGATRDKEGRALALWAAHLGGLRIDRVSTPMVAAFIEKRLTGCRLAGRDYAAASPRTVNLDLIALRAVLKTALESGHLRELPRFPRVKAPPPARRELLTPAEFDRLLAACEANKPDGEPVTKNGGQLRDFLRLLAFTGAREQEALCIKWAHVDFSARRVWIGAPEEFTAAAVTIGEGGTSKNRGSRVVDFNPQLESLLIEMRARRVPDCSWLFPSSQRGRLDIPARTLRASFKLASIVASLPRAGFHDLRHLFCSFCVMAGIDFMTIAAWLGHKDGGILIGKVYGHLLDSHRQSMAAKLTIGLAPVIHGKESAS